MIKGERSTEASKRPFSRPPTKETYEANIGKEGVAAHEGALGTFFFFSQLKRIIKYPLFN